MAIFQSSVLNKYLKQQDDTVVAKAYKKYVKYFHDATIQQNIKDSNEEQFQATFLNELFVKILGFTLNPQPKYNLTTEFKNVKNARKADGAILLNDEALAVIELKGTNTKDLESIRQQAFDYKANQPGCVYVVTSNFEKLRFYINNAVDFEEFDLFNLSYNRFELLYLCLHKDHLLKNVPLKIKEASLHEEEAITKTFYGDYSNFKRELFRDIVKRNLRNPELRDLGEASSKKALFKKTQKLLDRFLFIFFGEDRGLLPPNSIPKILDQWKQLEKMDAYSPLYDRYKKYFTYLNDGWKGEDHEIFAYNGGLFKPDPVLDTIEIDDTLLFKHTSVLTKYDFESSVDVNILGHIFEHSLNEIESVNAEIDGVEFDKQKTKRKKDGVFYTPKYITKYIVDNTVGKLCEEKKAELEILEEEYLKGPKHRAKKTIIKLDEQIQAYRNWLLTLTICDPACGSGAFLNQALEFLIQEHRWIDEMTAKLFGGGLVFQDVENSILENNIYGVDLNDESVEIAKLSLWLRTAQKGRKLTSLNNNIKCGNSLIDSKAVAGDKAFKWEDEFPEVFAKGGFDVVIGNPPYVGEKGHSEIFESLKKIKKWQKFYRRRTNLYYFFIKLGIELLKKSGIQSLIIPREFTSADWSNKVRFEILQNSKILSIVDFNDLKVFSDAGTTSLILTHEKTKLEKKYKFDLLALRNQSSMTSDLFDRTIVQGFSFQQLDESGTKPWNFYQDQFEAFSTSYNLSNYFEVSQGLVTGADRVTNKHIIKNLAKDSFLGRGVFILNEGIDYRKSNTSIQLLINGKWIDLNDDEMVFIKPFIRTEHLKKWFVSESSSRVIYTGSHDLKGNIKEYLLQFAGVLLNRSTTIKKDETIDLKSFLELSLDGIKECYSSAGAVQKIMRKKHWWMPLYERSSVPFEGAKIIVNTKNMDKFTYSDSAHYASGGGAGGQNFIYLKDEAKEKITNHFKVSEFIKITNAILNSKLVQKYIHDGQFNQLSTSKIGDIPFISIDQICQYKYISDLLIKINSIKESAINISNLNDDFKNFLNLKLSIEIDSSLIDSKFNLLDIFKKNNVSLSISEEAEWLKYLNAQKQKAIKDMQIIEKHERQIDYIVYELYSLTDEEVQIVENS